MMVKIRKKERQIIYKMWSSGSTQKEIADYLKISSSALRSELWKGFNGEVYLGGRRVYDPDLADRYSGISGRAAYRKEIFPKTIQHNEGEYK